ncbi:MAG: ferredoxin--NADP reductase [Acetobacteraceae bacterium]|nr:ferredoxin--NADP reductase [Acetobacteraceae bacterium]
MRDDAGLLEDASRGFVLPASLTAQTVLSVHHWTDRLFSLTMTRDSAFRFKNGQFAMIGLPVDGKPLLRAYSMVSANHADLLEFFSIKVAEGPLTSRLQHVRPGDTVLVGRKPTGTLVLDHLKPGRNLYLFATGTGLAPFMSLVEDPDLYDLFDRVILTHTVRRVPELAYAERLTRELPDHAFLGEEVRNKLVYYPSVTGEPFKTQGRITDLIRSGRLFADLAVPPIDPEHDRAMLCGSTPMLAEVSGLLEQAGLREGHNDAPAEYVIEKAFAER